jgi:hypothetical protein
VRHQISAEKVPSGPKKVCVSKPGPPERFRGFEKPFPRTDARCGEVVRGWHNRSAAYP